MKSSYSKSEFKDQCLSLLEEVAKKKRELVVTKRGQPIAKVVPIGNEVTQDLSLHGTLLKGFDLDDFQTEEIWEANTDT